MDRTPATNPPPAQPTTRGVAQCLVIGLACGIGVRIVAWVLPLGWLGLVLLPVTGVVVGAVIGRSVRVTPRSAGLAFLGGAMVWAVIAAGGGLLWPLRVIFGVAIAMVAAAGFASSVAWRQGPTRALPPG
ncbi:hypothetical protein [Rhabdothermincola salaria]|uniref:hypothetical protein n=1 Tax=Rhabdothermincola salaria TaxID=2903142 RepID=UPI001E4F04C4|nr:hypothetical protein [Rhabdothermincola salaria]MCD9625541.1 hypothetical protein [Rhabdothermincola salaria]